MVENGDRIDRGWRCEVFGINKNGDGIRDEVRSDGGTVVEAWRGRDLAHIKNEYAGATTLLRVEWGERGVFVFVENKRYH
jgi:hypothetical protein